MIIWFADRPDDWPREPAGGEGEMPPTGTFREVAPDGGARPAGSRVLVEVREALALGRDDAAEADAWFVPAGLGAHFPLLEALGITAKPVLVALNGLGPMVLDEIRRRLAGATRVLAFDARGQEDDSFREQLAWLSAQPEPFAVLADRPERFAEAALFGPHSLIVPTGARIEADGVLRIYRARSSGAPRPISPAEVDALSGREASLTVSRRKAADERLESEDLTIAVTETKGLSPALAMRVAGKRLRYALAPGEALTFGHLGDPNGEGTGKP